MSDNMDAMLALHAGADYAKPRILTVDRIDFGDHESVDTLIPELTAFREKNSDPSVTISGDRSETDDRLTGYVARRSETQQETSTRIDGYRRFVGDLGRRHRKARLTPADFVLSEKGLRAVAEHDAALSDAARRGYRPGQREQLHRRDDE